MTRQQQREEILGQPVVGLFAPTAGTVRWNEVDLAEADLDTAYTQVAVIAQEPARWPMTATQNIRIGRLDQHGRRALGHGAARVRCRRGSRDPAARPEHDPVQAVHQRPRPVGGQWQRIGVARGIYRDAVVLVADEPTAALDAKAEARVFDGLRHATRSSGNVDRPNRTTILVTHRLANIRHADRTVVLDQGRIAGHGTHDELITAGGIYQELFDIQASAFTSGP